LAQSRLHQKWLTGSSRTTWAGWHLSLSLCFSVTLSSLSLFPPDAQVVGDTVSRHIEVTALDFMLLLGGVAPIDLSFFWLSAADDIMLVFFFSSSSSSSSSSQFPAHRKIDSLFSGCGFRFGHEGFPTPALMTPKVWYVLDWELNRRTTGIRGFHRKECCMPAPSATPVSSYRGHHRRRGCISGIFFRHEPGSRGKTLGSSLSMARRT